MEGVRKGIRIRAVPQAAVWPQAVSFVSGAGDITLLGCPEDPAASAEGRENEGAETLGPHCVPSTVP